MEGEQVEQPYDSAPVEVSGPLDVRCLYGQSRCTRCIEADQDCYLENKRGSLQCLRCRSSAECQYQRLVLRQADAFSWDELTKDASAGVSVVDRGKPVKRKRSFDGRILAASLPTHRSPPRHTAPQTTYIPSGVSEPPSQLRGETEAAYVNTFYLPPTSPCPVCHGTDPSCGCIPYPHNETSSVGAVFGMNERYWFDEPVHPGAVPPDQRLDAINQHIDQIDSRLPWTSIDQSQIQAEPTMYELQMITHPANNSTRPRPDHYYSDQVGGGPVPIPPQSPANTLHDVDESIESRNGSSLKHVCDDCQDTFVRRSEYTKHMKRHDKPFRCDITGCARSDGFATQNDLDRHKATVHHITMNIPLYRCPDRDCKSRAKLWPRKDNFVAHIKRMHVKLDPNSILSQCQVNRDAQ